MQKINIYQIFTRLFGNKKTTNKPWGTIEENGVGKFHDIDDKALTAIGEMGITHIWLTGILHHDVITDYTAYGITMDDPDVVKGRAGSPYAVKDYYNVDPDLAEDPSKRMEEFESLVDRIHHHNMKVIIDIVPNHLARNYHSISLPPGIKDFGDTDDNGVEYSRDNNFYYIPGIPFRVPDFPDNHRPLNGERHPLSDGFFDENPAKWTGNGSRKAKPDYYDWYETVKLNYGVRPDGTYDFDSLPEDYLSRNFEDHVLFWKARDIPDTWIKFKDIVHYWLSKGIDGFRYDMAEMVPVEFWSYLNSSIKIAFPDTLLLAEVYNPQLYRDYILRGKMDYLYDKVGLYDTLRAIIEGYTGTDPLVHVIDSTAAIEGHMLHFLENHDEQRIASMQFAGDSFKAVPAMVVSAFSGTAPTLVYFGQHVGEPAADNAGFGSASRTTIFDYWGVPNHQRWMNGGAFDGGQLSELEAALHGMYVKILNLARNHNAFIGNYQQIHQHNRTHTPWYNDQVFSFVRWNESEKLIIVSNFNQHDTYGFEISIDNDLIMSWQLENDVYTMKDLLGEHPDSVLHVDSSGAAVRIDLRPLQSVVMSLEMN